MIALNAKASASALGRDMRLLAIGALRSKDKLGSHLTKIQVLADAMDAETASWVSPEALSEGLGGKFDACDLRHWLAIAQRSAVPAVPAQTILELSEDEMSLASGVVHVPEQYRERLNTAVQKHLPTPEEPLSDVLPPDHEATLERLATAMDIVPEGWMVRHVRVGASTLKAIAGAGAAGPEAPEAKFGPDLQVGPGWIRHGNRRSVDTADRRIVEAYAQGPSGPSVFVARPWIQAGRYLISEDPHRHGTQFAGKGIWPAEWRVFVFDGKVAGVAAYYGWCGEVSPISAVRALEARDLTERIVSEVARQKAYPLYPALEILRLGDAHPRVTEILNEFTSDRIAVKSELEN